VRAWSKDGSGRRREPGGGGEGAGGGRLPRRPEGRRAAAPEPQGRRRAIPRSAPTPSLTPHHLPPFLARPFRGFSSVHGPSSARARLSSQKLEQVFHLCRFDRAVRGMGQWLEINPAEKYRQKTCYREFLILPGHL